VSDEPAGSSSDPVKAPALSPEFLAGGTEAGLAKIRARLLDLTGRNRLLNFRHSRTSSLRVVDANLDTVFRLLMDGEAIAFEEVPEPSSDLGRPRLLADAVGSESTAQKRTAEEHAQFLGWNTSFDLDGRGVETSALRVLHYVDDLEAVTRRIGSAAKTAIEESGTNMLYLVLGFLEWYESDESAEPRLAPLLTVPVALNRDSGRSSRPRTGSKGKAFECTVEHSGEDLAANLSLAEKMRVDFGLEMPSLEEDDGPEQYFGRFAVILEQRKRWRVRRQITLALLSFGKLLMYRDLDPKTWPQIVSHPIVTDLFEGTKSDVVLHAEEHDVDDERHAPTADLAILDADSSQQSALIDALAGHNLVIEGPPGTGKSQTITNLIAGALAGGKTVLFVSEKLAALEVVRRRLNAAGLGQFCLELHSHKTRKDALIKDLADRIRSHRSFRDPVDLDRHLAALRDKRRLLAQYVHAMHQTVEPIRMSVFEIVWARERSYQRLSGNRELLERVRLPAVVAFARSDLDAAEQCLVDFAHHFGAVTQRWPSTDQHPWAWVGKPLLFKEEEHLVSELDRLTKAITDAQETLLTLDTEYDIASGGPPAGLQILTDGVEALRANAKGVDPGLAHASRDRTVRADLRVFVTDVEAAQEAKRAIGACCEDGETTPFVGQHATGHVARATAELRTVGPRALNIGALEEMLDRVVALEAELATAHRAFTEIAVLVDCSASSDSRTASLLASAFDVLEAAPLELLHRRSEALEADGAAEIVRAARTAAERLRARREALREVLDVDRATSQGQVANLRECAAELNAAGFWRRWFGTAYRSAVRTYRSLAAHATPRRAKRQEMAAHLLEVAAYVEDQGAFGADPRYRNGIGPAFEGVDSEWPDLGRLVAWYELAFLRLPVDEHVANDLRHFLFRARSDRLKALSARRDSLADKHAAVRRLTGLVDQAAALLPHEGAAEGSVQVQSLLHATGDRMRASLSVLTLGGVSKSVSLDQLETLCSLADVLTGHVAAAASNENAKALLGTAFVGLDTDVSRIRASVEFVDSLERILPPRAVERVLEEGCTGPIEAIHALVGRTVDQLAQLAECAELVDLAAHSSFWGAGGTDSLTTKRHAAQLALEHRDDLSPWSHFLRIRAAANERGLDKLTRLCQGNELSPGDLVPAFHFAAFNTLAHSAFVDHAQLSVLSGTTQDEVRRQFAKLDRRVIELSRERIAAVIDKRQVPSGNQSGPIKAWSELALINQEVKKQRRHIPIRQLVQRAGQALQRMKPCFMMGPLSVAQYLEPGKLTFDLVVMDEASQLKPEDAIGAIARGGQVVVVGDPKQLPPTNFFQRVSMEDDDDQERTVAEEGESILDVASTLYQPVRRLRWHYRSRHTSLIAFSNREFYQGDLIIFPSAHHDSPDLGVRYHSVGGILENRRNLREAAAVVEAVMRHMESRPNESLGVVAMNFEQRELIEEQLDRRLRTDPLALEYQSRMEGGAEPFFIKNLENVQGDERDVIFISATYGPDARGNQYQRFGPITGSNGHRRLNVLFTRAKKRVEVFSSLDPDRIQTDGSSSRGVRALKRYLSFAKTGILDAADDTTGRPTNAFEESVGTILKDGGFEVVHEVGVAGFFIDVGVRNPAKPGSYILGIECDGAAYHSAKSARDRDRLRQQILEDLGWRIHRIWSTDWFRNRKVEIDRLLKHVQAVLDVDPDYIRNRQKVRRSEALRSQLTDLRDQEIRAAFPDIPEEQGLLRSAVLEEFLRRRPRTKDDWFRVVPGDLRSATHSGQVGQFLLRVLDIINASFDDSD
jgi:hypothetical protein